MLNLWTFKLLAVLVLFVATVRSLTCNKCGYNTSKNKPLCNTTVETCKPSQAYCREIIHTDQNDVILYGKGCAAADTCGNPGEACKKAIKDEKLKSCSIKCCQGNLCGPINPTNVTTPTNVMNPANVITPCGMLLFMMAGLYCIFF